MISVPWQCVHTVQNKHFTLSRGDQGSQHYCDTTKPASHGSRCSHYSGLLLLWCPVECTVLSWPLTLCHNYTGVDLLSYPWCWELIPPAPRGGVGEGLSCFVLPQQYIPLEYYTKRFVTMLEAGEGHWAALYSSRRTHVVRVEEHTHSGLLSFCHCSHHVFPDLIAFSDPSHLSTISMSMDATFSAHELLGDTAKHTRRGQKHLYVPSF